MKTPERAVAIILRDTNVVLMERRNNGKHYFVFPGGGVEEGETIEEAVLREVMEETSLSVKVEKKLYTHNYDSPFKGRSNQYFYLCSHILGEPKLGDANEKEEMDRKEDFYKPQWVSLNQVSELLVYPLEIRDWLLEDIKNNFADTPKESYLRVEDLRESL